MDENNEKGKKRPRWLMNAEKRQSEIESEQAFGGDFFPPAAYSAVPSPSSSPPPPLSSNYSKERRMAVRGMEVDDRETEKRDAEKRGAEREADKKRRKIMEKAEAMLKSRNERSYDEEEEEEDEDDKEENESDFLNGIELSAAELVQKKHDEFREAIQTPLSVLEAKQKEKERQQKQREKNNGKKEKRRNLAPPRLEQVNGSDMVRPLDDLNAQQSNMEALCTVVRKFNWPPLSESDDKHECFFVLRWLENAFAIQDYQEEEEKEAAKEKEKEREKEGQSDGEETQSEEEGAETQSKGAERKRQKRKRGPGNKRNFYYTYTDAELRTKTSTQLIYERVGLDESEILRTTKKSGNVLNLEELETYVAGMHAYVLMLKRNLTQHVPLFPYQADLERQREIQRLYFEVNRDPTLGPIDESVPRNINQRLQRVHEKIAAMRVALRAHNEFASPSMRPHGIPAELLAYGLLDSANNLQTVTDSKKATARQEVISLLLQECFVNNYRRCGDQLYRQIQCNGFSSQAYVPHMSIHDFVWRLPDPVAQRQEWLMRTSDGSMQRYLEDYLLNVHNSHMLPDLKRTRDQWSFRNGIYTGHNNRFWVYGKPYPNDPECPFLTGSISTKYFDRQFDENLTTCPVSSIRVDSVEQIMSTQKWSEGVKNWLWIALGRLFYDVGQYDNWQFAPYLKGLAGTGKSTLVALMAEFYDASAVGTLDNDMEETFGLMSLHDKDLLLAPEIRPTFKLSQARYQTMVSGEPMSVPRKNQATISVVWRTPMLMAGNVYPNWFDSGGSLARRILSFIFDEPVSESNSMPDLKERIMRDLVKILVKCNRFYLIAAEKYSATNIWAVVPSEFLQFRNTMRQATSNVMLFLSSCSVEVNDVEQYVTLDQFIESMKAFGKSRDWRHGAINDAEVLRSIKQGLALRTSREDRLSQLRIESVSAPNKPDEWRIYGLRLPDESFGGAASSVSAFSPVSSSSVASAALVAAAEEEWAATRAKESELRSGYNAAVVQR